MPENFVPWEKYLRKSEVKQKQAIIGNLGITFLSILVAMIGLYVQFVKFISIPLMIALIILFLYDGIEMIKPSKVTTTKTDNS